MEKEDITHQPNLIILSTVQFTSKIAIQYCMFEHIKKKIYIIFSILEVLPAFFSNKPNNSIPYNRNLSVFSTKIINYHSKRRI